MEEYSMRSSASSDFFRILYAHLGGTVAAGALRSLAWAPLAFWMSWAAPASSIGAGYGPGALGFLVLALFLDPFLVGPAMNLSARIVAGKPARGRDLLEGLGRRYGAMLAWTWIQALALLLGLYNLLQLMASDSPVPRFIAILSAALSFWAWMLLRAMNLSLPFLLAAENLPFRSALARAFLEASGHPIGSLGHLLFRFGLTALLLASGVGLVLGIGSFGLLHGFIVQAGPLPDGKERGGTSGRFEE